MSDSLCSSCKRSQHAFLFNPQDGRVGDSSSTCQADRLIGGQASLAQEIARAKQRQGCFLAVLGEHAQPHRARLDVEHGVGALALRKYGLFRLVAKDSAADACTR